MKIIIDARLYGSSHTGNGRYTANLIENLIKIDSKNKYVVLLRKENYDKLVFPQNFTKVLVDIKHYSYAEQFYLPLIIFKFKPDLVHFPHFNVPLFYFGKYVVTIHDLIMHKFKGGEATTKSFPFYFIRRVAYHLSFIKAIFGSSKIIVPSNTVKEEIISFYKIRRNKVEVIYE